MGGQHDRARAAYAGRPWRAGRVREFIHSYPHRGGPRTRQGAGREDGPPPKTAEPNPLAAELALSRRDNLRLKQRLERAETIIELQKKVATLLGLPAESDGGS